MAEPRPIVIDGQTIRPKWEWSPGYRAAVSKALTVETPFERARALEALDNYARNWAARRGLACATDDELAAVKRRIRAEQLDASAKTIQERGNV